MDNINDIIWVLYSVVLTTAGHSLYRANKRLKFKPIINRILFGIMGSALYVGAYLYTAKDTPEFNYINMLILFLTGYYVEPLVNIFDEKLPDIIDRLVNKYLPHTKGTSDIKVEDIVMPDVVNDSTKSEEDKEDKEEVLDKDDKKDTE